MNTRKTVAVLAVALFVALAFSACPSSNGDTPGDGTPPVVAPPGMVRIPAGTFIMGSPTSETDSQDNERPQHTVKLSAFWMGKYEVTQARYEAVMGSLPNNIISNSYGVGDNYPVYYVSWHNAIVFCNKLSIEEGLNPAYSINNSTDPDTWGSVPIETNTTWNAVVIVAGSNGYRLPTEAQWEYACRAKTTTAFNTGATMSDSTGWYTDNSNGSTHEVGKKPANAWGLYDMHGNVWEWCWDKYNGYSGYPTDATVQTDPTGEASGDYRLIRGGAWNIYNASLSLRSAARYSNFPIDRRSDIGFRLVRP